MIQHIYWCLAQRHVGIVTDYFLNAWQLFSSVILAQMPHSACVVTSLFASLFCLVSRLFWARKLKGYEKNQYQNGGTGYWIIWYLMSIFLPTAKLDKSVANHQNKKAAVKKWNCVWRWMMSVERMPTYCLNKSTTAVASVQSTLPIRFASRNS